MASGKGWRSLVESVAGLRNDRAEHSGPDLACVWIEASNAEQSGFHAHGTAAKAVEFVAGGLWSAPASSGVHEREFRFDELKLVDVDHGRVG